MTEKLVGANNVKTKVLKQTALKRKLDYSHKLIRQKNDKQKMSHHLSEEQKRDIADIFNRIFNKPFNKTTQ